MEGGSTLSKRIRKSFAIVLVLTLVVAMLSIGGCKPKTDGEGGEPKSDVVKGGTFNFYISEPAFIDPVNLQESEGTQVGQAVFDSLVAFDPITSEVKPAAAERWEANDDATVWTFYLVEGAKFHDGTPVTAADFKYAWERICDPANESEISYHLAVVKGYDEMQDGTATELSGVKVVDDNTLEVTLNYGFADFEYVVGHPALAPVPKAAVEKDPAAFADMPIGNGPFKMSEPWAHDQYIKVEKFADYYGTESNIDGVDFKILADQDAAFLEFEAGNLDFVPIPTGQIQTTVDTYGESADGYTVNPGEQVSLGPEQAIYYLLINNEDPALTDANVRAALSLAIDRQDICDKVFEGTREPATGIVPPGIVGHEADAFQYAKYDVEAAKAKLAEAGFADGAGFPTITLEYNSGSGHEDILALVQEDLKAIGVNTELVGSEWAQYLDKLAAKQYQVGRLGWIADYPIMDNFLYPLFKTGSSDNYSFYTNPDVDEKLDEARTTVDADERLAIYKEVEKIVGDDAAVIPMFYYRHTRVASDRVNDGVYSANGLFTFETCWLSAAAE
ncbi:MAG: ABC transporter substrate-binding protein [Actinobacteria bacterium]|nr:ABC transporter substrate-binding protein [Actinomycetota bacterium]